MEDAPKWEEIEISSWKDIPYENADCYIYRGQSNSTWNIKSFLERTTERPQNQMPKFPNETEHKLLKKFKEGIKNYRESLPDENDYIGWLALMQHYGAPTRLIDFTKSFYIACYFALIDAWDNTEKKDIDSAVWAIEFDWLRQNCIKIINADESQNPNEVPRNTIDNNELPDEIERRTYALANKKLSVLESELESSMNDSVEENLEGIIPVVPVQKNERLHIQQGLFILPVGCSISFEKNLAVMDSPQYQCTKYILKDSMRKEGLEQLMRMNITSEMIYHGMEGFAKSLIHKLALA